MRRRRLPTDCKKTSHIKTLKKNSDMKIIFTKLRISAHCLHSETGRHKRPVVVPELRTCTFCNDGSIENEKHFLLNCKLYKDDRTTLFKSLSYINFNNYSENDKFTFLMSTGNGDTEIIKEILKFVNSAYEIILNL
jgi:hypothetical protein